MLVMRSARYIFQKRSSGVRIGYDAYAHFRPLDFGAFITAGYELRNGLYARLEWSEGLANIFNERFGAPGYHNREKNRNLNATLGWFIGSRKKTKATTPQ